MAETQRIGLAAAQRIADRSGQARLQRGPASAYIRLGRYDKARTHRLSIEAHREIGSRAGQAVVSGRLGDAYAAAGDPDASRDPWRYALEVLDELGHLDADDLRTKLG
jgi:hypothetical protein